MGGDPYGQSGAGPMQGRSTGGTQSKHEFYDQRLKKESRLGYLAISTARSGVWGQRGGCNVSYQNC